MELPSPTRRIQDAAAGKAPPLVTPIKQGKSFNDDEPDDPTTVPGATAHLPPDKAKKVVQEQCALEHDIECQKSSKVFSEDDYEDGFKGGGRMQVASQSTQDNNSEEEEEEDKKQRGRPKKEKEVPPVTPNGYESEPVSDYKNSPLEDPCDGSSERLVYGSQNEEGYLGEAIGDLPVVTHVNKALPTPCKDKEAKPQRKAPVEEPAAGGKRGGKKRSGEEVVMLSVEDMPKFDDKAFRKKYKKTFSDGERGSVWIETFEETTETKIVSRLSNRNFSQLPLSKSRKKGESKKVGRASQAFHVQTDDDDLFPGYIAGDVVLPPKAIKDAEGVGLCSQVINVGDCQPNSLEFALADPSSNDGEFDEKTAQRYLLSKGDIFQIPPGNVYRIENHSKTEDAKLFWTIIKCTNRVEEQVDSDSGEEQDRLNDEGRSQTENDCKGDAAAEIPQHTTANGVEREVLSEQDQGQKTLAGSNKRPRINSSSDGDDESKVGGGNDDEASGIAYGGEEQERSQQDSVDGIEAETAHRDDSFDAANQQRIFSPEKEEDHEVSEDERKSCVFDHHEGMAVSERAESGVTPEVGEINLPEEVELHQGSALESERIAFVSKEDVEHYKLQIKQMKERNSALEEAAKLKETIESELRSKLAEQVKTTANLKAQLDQVTGEKIKLEEQRLQHSKGWDEERQRMEAEHAAVVRRQEAELKAKDNQLSALKATKWDLT